MTPFEDFRKVHVVGAGLIGTSIALAAKELGYEVTLEDVDPRVELLAQDLIKNHVRPETSADNLLVVVAVPPLVTGQLVVQALELYPLSTVMDVASSKTNVLLEVESLSEEIDRFVPSHPIAGREIGGPRAAQSDLFAGRAWVITPSVEADRQRVERVSRFVSRLGATVYSMSPKEHDELFARISHLPQLISSALASLLKSEERPIQVAGQGLRDVTRLAESDSSLWSEIVQSNRIEVMNALILYRDVIDHLVENLEKGDFQSIVKIMDDGRLGRQKISGKHGSQPRKYAIFHIVIDDRPGVLGQLFSLMAEHEINVEDLNIEHSPNQETGLISIAVSPEQKSITSSALTNGKWIFHTEGQEQ